MITFRKASQEDIPIIAELEKEFGIDKFSHNTLINLLYSVDVFIVAIVNNTIVGYICGEFLNNKGHIISLLVRKTYRRKGIGSKLLKIFLNEARNRKVDRIYLEVSVENDPAIYLYKKFGFKIIDKILQYYRSGKDAYIMMIKLNI